MPYQLAIFRMQLCYDAACEADESPGYGPAYETGLTTEAEAHRLLTGLTYEAALALCNAGCPAPERLPAGVRLLASLERQDGAAHWQALDCRRLDADPADAQAAWRRYDALRRMAGGLNAVGRAQLAHWEGIEAAAGLIVESTDF